MKYKNKKVTVDGIIFDSIKESRRYTELKLLKRANEIKDFIMQKKFYFVINNQKVCSYICDFEVINNDGSIDIEDVKSEYTRKLPIYSIKKKLMKAIYNVTIKEI